MGEIGPVEAAVPIPPVPIPAVAPLEEGTSKGEDSTWQLSPLPAAPRYLMDPRLDARYSNQAMQEEAPLIPGSPVDGIAPEAIPAPHDGSPLDRDTPAVDNTMEEEDDDYSLPKVELPKITALPKTRRSKRMKKRLKQGLGSGLKQLDLALGGSENSLDETEAGIKSTTNAESAGIKSTINASTTSSTSGKDQSQRSQKLLEEAELKMLYPSTKDIVAPAMVANTKVPVMVATAPVKSIPSHAHMKAEASHAADDLFEAAAEATAQMDAQEGKAVPMSAPMDIMDDELDALVGEDSR